MCDGARDERPRRIRKTIASLPVLLEGVRCLSAAAVKAAERTWQKRVAFCCKQVDAVAALPYEARVAVKGGEDVGRCPTQWSR